MAKRSNSKPKTTRRARVSRSVRRRFHRAGGFSGITTQLVNGAKKAVRIIPILLLVKPLIVALTSPGTSVSKMEYISTHYSGVSPNGTFNWQTLAATYLPPVVSNIGIAVATKKWV